MGTKERKTKKKSPVLVTGGAGFMGSHIADELVDKGQTVVVLDNIFGDFVYHVPREAIFVRGSVTDYELVKKLFEKYRFEHVYHLGAYAAEGLSHFIKPFNYEVNLMGSINLITEAIKHEVKSFVFTSSIAVYGANQLPMKEDMTPEPEDPYGISKYAVELELKASKRMFDLNSVIFRPHNVYGERQNIGDKYRNVIGIFMNKALLGEPFPIFGDGKQRRAFTHIADVASCIAQSAFMSKAQNKVFNVGSDKPYTVNKLARVVAKAMDVPFEIEYLPARNEVKYAYSDHEHLKKIFNYKPTVGLEEGVARMAAWAKTIGPQKQYIFENIAIEKNLPPSWRT